MIIDFQAILESKIGVAIVAGICGGFLTRLLGVLKNRIQELEYTVTHDRVGISVDDPVFGRVKAIWNDAELSNLYNSTVTITNNTTKDLTNVVVKVYTATTQLLTQHVSIKDSTYVPQFTDAFILATQASAGEQPTQVQLDRYLTSREYKIEVLNRGQTLVLQYLSTEPKSGSFPAVFAEIQQEGLRAIQKKIVPEVHGVPLRRAIAVGLIASLGILIALVCLGLPIWLTATSALCTGLVASSIGAWLHKLGKG